jgi:hypothetical protein
MGDENSNLVTIVILVIAALIIIWLFVSLGDSSTPCVGPRPDPVGGIVTSTGADGLVTISWDRPANATSFKLYINNCPAPVTSGKKSSTKKVVYNANSKAKKSVGKNKVGSCGGPDCCPSDASTCTACVSQTKYKKIIATEDTEVIIETCEPCLCFMIVPYNSCGQAGPCNEIHYVDVQCTVDVVDAWIGTNDCNGTHIHWNPPRCADSIIILVDGQEVERVAASEGKYSTAQVPDNLEIAVQAVSECGVGEITVVRAPVASKNPTVGAGSKSGVTTSEDEERIAKMREWKRAQSNVSAGKKTARRRQAHPRGRQPTTHTTVKKYDIRSGSVKMHHV